MTTLFFNVGTYNNGSELSLASNLYYVVVDRNPSPHEILSHEHVPY